MEQDDSVRQEWSMGIFRSQRLQREKLEREKLERDKLCLLQAADSGPEKLWEYFQEEIKNCKKKVREEMDRRLSSQRAQLHTAKHNHATREKELSDQLEQAREEAKATKTQLQEQLWKEQERKKQEGKEQEIEGRLRLAIEEGNARVRQDLYNGFFEHFDLEKALLLMEGVHKDIQEMRRDMKKDEKMKPGEEREEDLLELGELKPEQERLFVGEEHGSNAARD